MRVLTERVTEQEKRILGVVVNYNIFEKNFNMKIKGTKLSNFRYNYSHYRKARRLYLFRNVDVRTLEKIKNSFLLVEEDNEQSDVGIIYMPTFRTRQIVMRIIRNKYKENEFKEIGKNIIISSPQKIRELGEIVIKTIIIRKRTQELKEALEKIKKGTTKTETIKRKNEIPEPLIFYGRMLNPEIISQELIEEEQTSERGGGQNI
jgi:hypothetical protein